MCPECQSANVHDAYGEAECGDCGHTFDKGFKRMEDQTVDMAREVVITIFNDSAAMAGNEAAFEAALDIFEQRVRAAAVIIYGVD